MSEWDWELTDTARRDFDSLDNHARDRIASKLDEIVTEDGESHRTISIPWKVRPTKNSVLGRSDSGVELIEARASSMSCGFENAVAMRIAVTMTDYPANGLRS